MGVRVEWDDSNAGYVVSYDVPRSMYKIDPAQGNGDPQEFYEQDVDWRLTNDLVSFGIGSELMAL